MIKAPVKQRHQQKGMLLIEAMIAVMIFSMGILALMGLQGAMLKNTSDNKYRVDASYIAQQRLAKIWANPSILNTFGEVNTDISGELANGEFLPNGQRTTQIGARGLVTIIITWDAPGQDSHKYETASYVGVF